MKNLEKYAEEGQKKIEKNSRFDMQVSDMDELLKLARVDMCEALRKAFNAGVEAGSRIEKKAAAEKMDKAMSGMIDAQMKMTAAVIKAERS